VINFEQKNKNSLIRWHVGDLAEASQRQIRSLGVEASPANALPRQNDFVFFSTG
jgi:hypothetical protein